MLRDAVIVEARAMFKHIVATEERADTRRAPMR